MDPHVNPEVEEYRRQFEAIKADAQALVNGLTDEQFNWRPAADRWSVSECIVHLNATAGVYLPLIDAAIEQARSRNLYSQGPFRHGAIGNWFVRSLEPPPKRRFKAAKAFLPASGQPLALAVPEFLEWQDRFLERIRNADGLDLSRAKVALPMLRFVKLTLGQSFGLMAAHERRHLWQAREVRKARDLL